MAHIVTDPSTAIVFEPLHPDVCPPERQTRHSAGYDVRAHVRGRTVRVSAGGKVHERAVDGDALRLAPGETALVPLGFRARLPAGYEAQVRVRSSVAFRKELVLPNAPGTIDADYPDEWLVMMRNAGTEPAEIAHGERIAQVVLAQYVVLGWVPGEVRVTTERGGGLGSTG